MPDFIDLAWASLKRNVIPFNLYIKEGRRKDNYFTCRVLTVLQYNSTPKHSSSFTDNPVIYTTSETWRYNLAANKLTAAWKISKSRAKWMEFIAWWYTWRMYHSSYIKTLALELNILLEAATAWSNYDCIFQGLHLFQTMNVDNTTYQYNHQI